MNEPAPSPRPGSSLILPGLGLALALALTLPPLSATRMFTWPWALGAAALWSLPILVAGVRLGLGRPHSRFGGLLDAAFLSLAAAGMLATALSPLRATIAPALLPFFGALALPYALLPVLRSSRADTFATAFIYPVLLVSAFLWLAAPDERNAHPFGHANTTGSVCALAACWLAGVALRASTRAARLAHAGGVVLAVALAASSSSRGAVLALAVAAVAAAALVLLRRKRVLPFLGIAAFALIVAILSNHRLRELVRTGAWSSVSGESNAQRVAMIEGGFMLALQRPFFGWGPGSVPHVFPAVRGSLPGVPDNYLQLHNSLAQSAATLGGLGLAAVILLVLALGRRLRRLAGSSAQTTLIATVICGFALLLFDHSFATPAFALLAALPVAALGLAGPSPAPATLTLRRGGWVLSAALIAGLALPVGRDLAARAVWDSALGVASADQPAAYAASLRRAIELNPADPFYSDQLASHLATGTPFPGLEAPSPADAIPLLRAVLARNPAHESAHYNLGWLLLRVPPGDPAAASEHFTTAARLAPARAGVWFGLALARIHSRSPESPIPALATEVLLDPAFAWSPHWRDPAIAPYRREALARAADFLVDRDLAPIFATWLRNPGDTVDYQSAYRRLRTGHGVLYGHPDGPAPADANVLLTLALPPGLAADLPEKGFVSSALLLESSGLMP